MRMWVSSTRPSSHSTSRCLPWLSTCSMILPAWGTGPTRRGASKRTIRLPASAVRMALADRWMVSPSGIDVHGIRCTRTPCGIPHGEGLPCRLMSSPDPSPPAERTSARRHDPAVRLALRHCIPLFLPAIPFALVLGLAITESAMPTSIAWSTNVVVFAGAAQLATVSLAATATWVTLVATAAIINLRHVMYSAALAPRFCEQPGWFRWVGPFFLIDQLFALGVARPELSNDDWRRYYLTAGVFFFTAWNLLVTTGLLLGSAIPTEWRLDVAPAIMFAGLVVLGLSNRPGIVAAVVGAGVCFATLEVPNNGSILLGAVSGVIAGYVADVMTDRAGAQA